MPGPVMTKMVMEKHKQGFAIVNPEDFVPPALAQVGLRNVTYGHWKHALFVRLFPTLAVFRALTQHCEFGLTLFLFGTFADEEEESWHMAEVATVMEKYPVSVIVLR